MYWNTGHVRREFKELVLNSNIRCIEIIVGIASLTEHKVE